MQDMNQLDEIDAQFGVTLATASDDDYEDDTDNTDDYDESIESAVELLKATAVLLQFLGDENFCKNITKRERVIIAKHVDRIYDMSDHLEQLIGEKDE